ncbi:MAG: GDP-mannose 4,6-dehydratase [Tannerellaceae bacterium]|jgi:UDP-glucuronate 4-epimerase|nr:GDP-mannose 4,6-dehydratase [Tannerellaceae bacterium]
MKILVTGSAGFVGFHLVERLVKRKDSEIIGIDNINDYYDINLKYARLERSGIARSDIETDHPVKSAKYHNYLFYRIDISDYAALSEIFRSYSFDVVINMAAQAGVRYSIENPHAYIQSNIVGFTNVLECCRYSGIKHLIYASSSSVYGISNKIPFSEDNNTNYPVSIYAATKKSDELLAHSYSHLFRLPTTGVRLFTVYGPWGRPDMAPMLFAEAIMANRPIHVFNNGEMSRDFTYVDDIVDGIVNIIEKAPGDNAEHPFYQLFNIGNSRPVELMRFISMLEKAIGRKANIEMFPMQPGDVSVTYADTGKLEQCIHYKPATTIEAGIASFIHWLKYWKS